LCHPLTGGKGGTQYQRGVRDLRFERADYQTSDLRLIWCLETYLPAYGWTHGAGRFLDCARNDIGEFG
jgi:hypothetical protein